MDVKSVSDYIEQRYNSLVAYLARKPADGASMIKTVSAQCFGAADYYDMVAHDAHIWSMWGMWSEKFDALYGGVTP